MPARLLAIAAALAGLPAAAQTEPPQKPSVAVMQVAAMQGVESNLADPVADLLANAIRSLERYRVFGQADIEAMLGVQETKQKLGCTDTSCLAEIGGALGADLILSGNLSRLGSTLLLNLRLIDQKKVEVTKGVSRKITGGDEGLIDAVPQAVAEIFGVEAPVIAETRTGEAPPPPPPPRKARPTSKRTVTVDLRTSVKGAEVFSNGKLLGNAPLLVELKRGKHRFVARAPGYEGELRTKIREPVTVTIELKAVDLLQIEETFRIDAKARYAEWEASGLRAQGVSFGEYVLRTEHPGHFEDYQASEEAQRMSLAAYLEGEFRTLRNVGIGLTFGVGLGAAVAGVAVSNAACPKTTDKDGKRVVDGDSKCAKATGWTLYPVAAGATAAGIALWVIYAKRANRAEALKTDPVDAPPEQAGAASVDWALLPLLDERGVPGGLGLTVRF